jgi:hypothetical protein
MLGIKGKRAVEVFISVRFCFLVLYNLLSRALIVHIIALLEIIQEVIYHFACLRPLSFRLLRGLVTYTGVHIATHIYLSSHALLGHALGARVARNALFIE